MGERLVSDVGGGKMIWGKTFKQKRIERIAVNARWFAWKPVQLNDGRWIWWTRLQRVYRDNWGGPWYDYFVNTKETSQ